MFCLADHLFWIPAALVIYGVNEFNDIGRVFAAVQEIDASVLDTGIGERLIYSIWGNILYLIIILLLLCCYSDLASAIRSI
jgi:hypothetical protein